mmetsp:Transcript_26286/g.39805  ORF Transcript_26286/g.39805 Transcript_26286/m.39805 type:complete len:507 (-) Transcript_26286:1397-2917(-)
MMANSRRSSEKKNTLNLFSSWFGGGSKEDDEEGGSLSKHNAKLSSLSQPTPTLVRMTSNNETTMVEPGNLSSKNSMVSADSAQSSITNSWAPPKFRRYCPPPSFQHSDAPIENMVITVKKKGASKARRGDATLPPVVEDATGRPNVSDQRVFKNYGKRVSSNEKPNIDAPETEDKSWFFWSSHINRNDDVTSDINTCTSRDWTVKSIDPVSPKIIEESILELQETLGMEVKCLDDVGTNSHVTAKETFHHASECKHGEDDKTLKTTADWLGKIAEIRVATHNDIGQLSDNRKKLPDQKRNSVQEQLKAFHRPMRMDYSNDSEMFREIESSINKEFLDIRNQMLTSGLSLREIAAFFHGIALMTAQVRSMQIQSANEANDTSLDHFRTPSFCSRGPIHEADSSLQNIEPILFPGGDHVLKKSGISHKSNPNRHAVVTNEQILIETQNDYFAGNSAPKVGNQLNADFRNENEFAGQPDNTDNHIEWTEIAISVVDSDDSQSNRYDESS